jgi:hypothetical protein
MTWRAISARPYKQEEFGPDGKKKRKHTEEVDEEHAEFDPNALREVGRVSRVRFGGSISFHLSLGGSIEVRYVIAMIILHKQPTRRQLPWRCT